MSPPRPPEGVASLRASPGFRPRGDFRSARRMLTSELPAACEVALLSPEHGPALPWKDCRHHVPEGAREKLDAESFGLPARFFLYSHELRIEAQIPWGGPHNSRSSCLPLFCSRLQMMSCCPPPEQRQTPRHSHAHSSCASFCRRQDSKPQSALARTSVHTFALPGPNTWPRDRRAHRRMRGSLVQGSRTVRPWVPDPVAASTCALPPVADRSVTHRCCSVRVNGDTCFAFLWLRL